MNFHIISVLNPNHFITSRIPSYRLRLSYVFNAAKELGFKVSGNLSVSEKADIYYVGKLTHGIDKTKIKNIIIALKKSNAKIFIDYTDDWIHVDQSPNKAIYEELLSLNATVVVPVKGLGEKLQQLGKNTIVIPDGIDDIPNTIPISKKNEKKNLLWHGHSSNINSLIRVLSNELVDYNFNLHLVTNPTTFEIIKNTKFKIIPKCKLFPYYWSIETLQEVSQKCDFAILPIDKIWASANRMVSNFRLGLPIIAETISSYVEYSSFYTDFTEPNISNMFRSPEKWHELVKIVQNKINKDFDKDLIMNYWKDCFR